MCALDGDGEASAGLLLARFIRGVFGKWKLDECKGNVWERTYRAVLAAAVVGIPGGVRLNSGAERTALGTGAGTGVQTIVVADSSKLPRMRREECIFAMSC